MLPNHYRYFLRLLTLQPYARFRFQFLLWQNGKLKFHVRIRDDHRDFFPLML
jgi:hypothetical protein